MRLPAGMVSRHSGRLVVVAPPESSLYFLGVVGSGIAHALVQERMVRTMPRHLPLLITASEFGVCSVLSAALIALTERSPKAGTAAHPLPLSRRARLSFLSVTALLFVSVVCSNLALTSVTSLSLLPIAPVRFRTRRKRTAHLACPRCLTARAR